MDTYLVSMSNLDKESTSVPLPLYPFESLLFGPWHLPLIQKLASLLGFEEDILVLSLKSMKHM